MTRPPLIPTILVLLAVAVMLRLGFWQLERKQEKEAAIALAQANARKPGIAMAAVIGDPRRLDEVRYRRATGFCLQPVAWRVESGRAASGATGYRHIAACKTGAEGPGLWVDVGVSRDPRFEPVWRGGQVSGAISVLPVRSGVGERLSGKAPPAEPLLIADEAAEGLLPTAQPNPASITNNHLGYAIQWFLFAGAALVIYALALRARAKRVADPPKDG